jgi:4-amino-4-deoxy-L-arabinose transferase-like glycosyltransferase
LPFDTVSDMTEARYAEMAHKMFLSGDFITPFIGENVPFWGKPPLSFWTGAISLHIFGVNDFAVRFPSFLFSLGMIFLTFFFTRKHFDNLRAHVATVVLLCSPIFLFLMGGVMTDQSLAFAVILSFFAFYNALEGYGKKASVLWGYAFFIGLGLGLLAKGPVVLFLVGSGVGLWVIIKNKWKLIWKKIPWFTGTALMLAIALPWYILAEQKTPGFLRYFIIGEHFERYLVPGWEGDLYGQGRGGYFGIIWVYLLISILPWPIYLAYKSFSKSFVSSVREIKFIKDEKIFYVLLIALGQLIFFTFSKNLHLTYTLPFLASVAILISLIICKSDKKMDVDKFVIAAAFGMSIIILFVLGTAGKYGEDKVKSDKFIMQKYEKVCPRNDAPLVYYKRGLRHSTHFYAKGSVEYAYSQKAIEDYADKYGTVCVLVKNREFMNVVTWHSLHIEKIAVFRDATLVKIEKK